MRRSLEAEGVDLREQVQVQAVERAGNGVAVVLSGQGDGPASASTASTCWSRPAGAPTSRAWASSWPGVAFDRQGHQGRRPAAHDQRRIYAIGDVAGGLQFTHVGGYHAGIVIRNALFRLPAKVDYRGAAVGHLHRSRARPGRAERGAGARAGHAARGAALAVRRERPRPGRARDRGAGQGRSSAAAAGSSARRSSARMPAS